MIVIGIIIIILLMGNWLTLCAICGILSRWDKRIR